MASDVLIALLNELTNGTQGGQSWVLNPGDRGLLASLDQLSAAEASAIPPAGGASIAAHVDHLRYGLELLNRWSGGDDPFKDADYSASWRRTTVSEAEWAALRASLRREIDAWTGALGSRTDPSTFDQLGMVASIVHLAYHIGAIRQINRTIAGPPAND